jgi:kinesin family protein 13
VDNRETGYTYFWDIEKFGYRYYLIKDLWEKFLETGEVPTATREEDPFWDAPEHIQIGNGFLTMLSLAYMLDQHSDLALVA